MGDLLTTPFTIRYDAGGDVLYLTMQPGAPATTREGEPGVLWRFDERDGHLIGVTVVDFASVWCGREQDLAGLIAGRFGIPHEQALEAVTLAH